jgi:hypothetical protein
LKFQPISLSNFGDTIFEAKNLPKCDGRAGVSYNSSPYSLNNQAKDVSILSLEQPSQ